MPRKRRVNIGRRPRHASQHVYSQNLSEERQTIIRENSRLGQRKELDDLESLPIPNEERDFSLPEQDYGMEWNATEEAGGDAPPHASNSVSSADSNGKAPPATKAAVSSNTAKEAEKKAAAKRTRGSMSNESISPSTTPPPVQSSKRCRI